MLAVSAALRSKTLITALCGLTAACGGMAAAQGAGNGGPGVPGGPADAANGGSPPVIAAPRHPGRSAPSSAYAPTEFGGLNSFAATDTPPPMESFGLDAIPVVVELFTSQGCSSCPAADAMLATLAGEPGILPLSFHVDYWDYLGWADSFARPEFTARQESYARAAGEHAVYTPQLIVGGVDTAVALGPAQLMGLIDASRVAPAMVSVQREATKDGQRIELMPLSDLGGGVEILLIRYAPERAVEMTAGENRGKVVTYTNVVLSLDRLAEWDGSAPLRMTVSPDGAADDRYPEDTRHALLVQKEQGGDNLPGPILAAIRLD
ncbi:DUF1223 domain-containing protein [Paracoccus benzoatiresistens]|uniref:DUF1223 domain-containing protein n=1 Tax=Paracoccus benzoatiresistens TaxID=2997341 RepID=A0ABT4J468_9RHOB|nr:DUF1223 domain-containing protein [Paracoccus sp. EF6]MCZ0961900.1 DUF1223 domain-containing protein [Paracoccus sp. EF6]